MGWMDDFKSTLDVDLDEEPTFSTSANYEISDTQPFYADSYTPSYGSSYDLGDSIGDFKAPSQSLTLFDSNVSSDSGSGVSPSLEDKDTDGGSIFTDRRFLGPLLQTGLGLASQAFTKNSQENALKKAAEDKKQQALMELELEKLKYKYGLKGGSGGGSRGGGGGGGSQRGAQLLAAYQNYIQGVQSINQGQQGSIRNLGNAISSGYAAGRR